MESLKYSPNDIHALCLHIQEIVAHIYKVSGDRTAANLAYRHHFPNSIMKNHSSYHEYFQIITPNGLTIKVSNQTKPRTLTLAGHAQGYDVIIQTIEQDGEHQPVICELAPYLNPYLNILSEHIDDLYEKFDLSHERKRQLLIQKFLK